MFGEARTQRCKIFRDGDLYQVHPEVQVATEDTRGGDKQGLFMVGVLRIIGKSGAINGVGEYFRPEHSSSKLI